MISEEHPYYFIAPPLMKKGAILHLSKYIYKSDSLLDDRENFSIHSSGLTKERVFDIITSLSPNHELAIHSNVVINGRTWHIPMIDFVLEGHIPVQVIDRLRQFLPRSVFLNMAFFASGRSFHAYSTALLSPKEWHNFMGRLLLITPARGMEIVAMFRLNVEA